MSFETSFSRMVRLAPDLLHCDDAAFIAAVYVTCLGRDPEFDPAENLSVLPPGDRYQSRLAYLHVVIASPESQARGHAAMVAAIAMVLGERDAGIVTELIGARYPTVEHLVGGLAELMAHVRDNSRRQDGILALAAA